MRVLKVYDCDGVLVDSSARYRTVNHPVKGVVIDLAFWRENCHTALEVDKLLPHAAEYQNALYNDANAFVVIATARQMSVGCAEMRHICEVLGKPQALIYRKEGDNRGGAELKLAGLRKLLNLKQFKNVRVEIYEDNNAYMQKMCDTIKAWGFDVIGHYIPSEQGH